MKIRSCQESLNAVMNLSADERMSYFVYKVSLSGRLYLLADEENYFRATCDGKGDEILSVWPLPEFIFRTPGEKETSYITAVELRKFLDEYVPQFARDNIYIGIFPSPPSSVCKMKPETFKEMMEDKVREIKEASGKISYANVVLQLADNHKIYHKPEKRIRAIKNEYGIS